MKTFLHVWCGRLTKENIIGAFNSENWSEIRYDIDPAVVPDIVGSIADMSTIAPESIDAIYSNQNIEHLYHHEAKIALAEFHRVLVFDGFAIIGCPDIMELAKKIINDGVTSTIHNCIGVGPLCALDYLYGLGTSIENGNTYMAHKTGFTEQSLRDMLYGAGFPVVATTSGNYNIWAVASKLSISLNLLQEMALSYFPYFTRP